MTDLRIDPTTEDISLTQGLVDTVTGKDSESKAQRIRARLLTVRGEWLTDVDFGLDYFGVIWVKTTPRPVLVAHVQREILQEADPGEEIRNFELTYDGVTRTLSIAADLVAADGAVTAVSL